MTNILIIGPTASGKSALALALAAATGGAIVNADSMQVYDGWRVLTARPSPEDEAAADHRLYGHIPLTARYSVGAWLADVKTTLADLRAQNRPAIIVGGTGLYFEALTKGLAPIPPIPPEIEAEAETLIADQGRDAFYKTLLRDDPQAQALKDPQNPARLLRAWMVKRATGRSLFAWAAETPPPLVPLQTARALALDPPREQLYARCDARFDAMLDQGALDEAAAVAAAIAAQNLDPALPGVKALGGPELIAYSRGEMALEAAAVAAKTATRNYAKRQMTWLRGRMRSWRRVGLEEYYDTRGFVRNFLQNS